MVFARCTVRVHDALCTMDVSQCAQSELDRDPHRQVVWCDLVKHIVHIPSVAEREVELWCVNLDQLFVGCPLALNWYTQNAVPSGPPLFQSPMRYSLVPKRAGGGTPESTGPAIPSCALSRRLWHWNSSVHDDFHMLCAISHSENVGV